jgi:hypothetical protein
MNQKEPDHLLDLIRQVAATYQPPPPKRKRGRQPHFSPLSFLLLAVVAVVTKTFCDSELFRLLRADEDLRYACGFSRTPHRTTILRRLKTLYAEAEQQIAVLGQVIVTTVAAGENQTVGAIDGRLYEAVGAKWHSADRLQNRIPAGLRNVDTESYWSKSHYRGWVQGYRLTLQTLVFPEPVPLFAAFRSNKEGEITTAKTALKEKQLVVTDVLLGDEAFSDAGFRAAYRQAKGWVLTHKQLSKQRRSWKHDLFAYRKETIELLFQRICQALGIKSCPAKGTGKNAAFVLAGVWLYQICWLRNYRDGKPAAMIKEQIDLARWRTPI